MATRLKSFARNRWVKAASFLLCVALALGAVSMVIWMADTKKQDNYVRGSYNYFDYLSFDEFYNSYLFYGRINSILETVKVASGWTAESTNEVMAAKDKNFERLGAMGGVYYWVSTKHMVLSNTERDEDFFSSKPVNIIFVDGELKQSTVQSLPYELGYMLSGEPKPEGVYGTTLFFCVDDAVMSMWENEFDTLRAQAWRFMGLICLLALLSALCLVHLIIVAGRRPDDDKVSVWWLDRVWWEVLIVLLVSFGAVAVAVLEQGWERLSNTPVVFRICMGALAISWMLAIELMLSASKRIKRRELWRGSLCLIILRAVWVAIKSFCVAFASSMPLSILAAGGLLILVILNAAAFYAPPVAALFTVAAMVGLVWWTNGLSKIIKGVRAVKAGKLDTVIALKGGGKLSKLAEDINGISEGLQARVESELRSERMKTELITNVSHDLRTPLTSVLTYVDLLKTAGLNSPEALKYLAVVEQKSARLKQLTDDLFEAAKASSGSITPVLEDIELRELVDQSLGELSGRIEERGLDFRVSGENVKVRADGRMLWRCLENLLGNIFKYAVENSRVYVIIDERDQMGRLTIKNISAYELGMDASELTERFTRGDSSRGGDGSGLGLAIVKDFVRLQHGSLEVGIDGDLFKTIITLPLASREDEG